MERPCQFIGDVTDKSDFWKLTVRVKDKWTVVKDGKEHLEMIIVDVKGRDIQVVIPTTYKATYDKILEENATYTLCNFQVVNAIGVVQEMGFCQLNQGTGKKLQVNFTMKDLSDISINCTLWEEYAAQFIKYNSERKEGGSVVVMLKYTKIKEEGRFPLSVSNTYTFTKLYINEDIHEINLFKGSLPREEQNQSQSQLLCTQSYGSSQLSSEITDRIGSNNGQVNYNQALIMHAHKFDIQFHSSIKSDIQSDAIVTNPKIICVGVINKED
ncbi:plant OB fold protein, putative [Medicago truncatula]|uniref:Plant OB fold protein, putative n=1 Tax=Medicago truncatula TaxID=3880 RepID=G7KAG5_MEDTR|nr:plant OB fold protein, putative [Medicago truncatula]